MDNLTWFGPRRVESTCRTKKRNTLNSCIEMDKFVIKLKKPQQNHTSSVPLVSRPITQNASDSQLIEKLDLGSLKADPGERIPIARYAPKIKDDVRRYYIAKGPCQPREHEFPQSLIGGRLRRFCESWFDGPFSRWLEYSVTKDAAFCLCCYLFKNEFNHESGDCYTKKGVRFWNKPKEKFDLHVGDVNSIHQNCFNKMLDFANQDQSIVVAYDKQGDKQKSAYHVRLEASVDVTRLLLQHALPFRDHDESESSTNPGLFLGVLRWHGDKNPDVGKVILQNAPRNDTLTSPMIQKDIVNACAKETLKIIMDDLDGDSFGILVDESKDISGKEQMALVLRYVNSKGEVIERFVGLVHVRDTSVLSLKEAIYSLLMDHSLSPCKIRGQGYDGASNMNGEIKGLKTLIMQDSRSAHYIHCFAHQLQLTLVAIAKKHLDVEDFFAFVSNVLNVIGASSKRRDLFRDAQLEILKRLLETGEVYTGQGLNQERGLQRPGDTRWGSHFRTLDNFVVNFSSIVHVLGEIKDKGSNPNDRLQAECLLGKIETYKFVFMLYLMMKVLAISNELSKRLQKRDQDIVNAMEFLDTAKNSLEQMRENGWEELTKDVSLFCDKHGISIPKMEECYFSGKSKRKSSGVSYSHHLRVEIFYAVIDLQLQELNDRFDVVGSDLLLGMASLNPANSFANFDKSRVMALTKYYLDDFSEVQIRDLSFQLDTFIAHMRRGNPKFSNLQGICDLAKTLVKENLAETFSLVYLLLKLTLILPVATATVERAFSSMKHIKNEVRNSIGDQYLNDCLVCYIERDIFTKVSNDAVIHRFQNMKNRKGQL